MIIVLKEVISLLPILIIGVTVIIILLSIAYDRNQFIHAGLAIAGLCAAIVSLIVIWFFQHVHHNVFQLVCVDNFSILYSILILISSVLSGLLAYKWLLRHIKHRSDEFYLLLLISSIGGVLLTTTNHLATLFLGMELLSLPLFGLIGYSFFKRHFLEASVKYIVLSGVSSSFLLLGMALIYAETGCLLFAEINQFLLISRATVCLYQPMLILGIGMMIVGFGFKLSFVPFHLWTADIYQGAPYPISMYLMTGIKIASVSALMRFLLVFPEQYSNIFDIFLSGTACLSILFGSILAIQQNSIKRVLAYSSIAHTGYLLGGFIVLKSGAIVLETIGIYLISYLISNVGIFSIVGIISNECGIGKDTDSLSVYRGLFWKRPVLSVLFTIILLSLAGMPITLGFIGKFYLFILGIDNKLWCIVAFIGIGSIIGMFYYLNIMIGLYLRPVGKTCLHTAIVSSNWVSTVEGIIATVFTIFILFLGVYPQPMIYWVRSIL